MTSDLSGPVLIAYDGSRDARAAIGYAGTLVAERESVVLTVWEPLLTQVDSLGMLGGFSPTDDFEVDRASEQTAREIAEEGVRLAEQVGIPATARWEEGPAIWATVVETADALDAALIVTGTRGLSRVKSLVMGSISDRILHHAGRPVLVIPAREAAPE